MTGSFERLKSALADRYRIERELGAGGMATVYLAHDVKHDRKVAIKVLRPELAAALGAERFLREIKTTARLRHPHILPLYDSGEADGYLFYVMPVVGGESLRDRLDREKQLPVDDALLIVGEVVDALSSAHRSGVVHRDIKPENILLEDGHAVLADFGIARAITAAGGDELTATGLVVGTPTYMSPEQAGGREDVDRRSDLYSLGCVLYEALAGVPPFVGPTPDSLIRQHMIAEPPTIRTIRATIPEAIEVTLTRALAKSPADRFQSAQEFANALKGGATQPMLPSGRMNWRARVALYVTAAALVLAAGYLGLRRFGQTSGGAEERRIVVLPFENVGLPDEAHFASGITDEITSRLGEVPALAVISRRSALRYRDVPLGQIAEDLDVQFVLEGTVRAVRQAGGPGQVTITPELIQATDDTQLWTTRYVVNVDPGEIFRIQTDIAAQVAGALGIVLTQSEHDSVAVGPPTDNAEAYEHFLRANDYLSERNARSVGRAIEEYEAAIALDPEFTRALARLGYAYAVYLDWPAWDYLTLPRDSMLARGIAAADRSVSQDSTLSDAWMARAYLLEFRYPSTLDGVREAFDRAISLEPRNAEALHQFGSALTKLGDDEGALTMFSRAIQLEPERPITLAQMGIAAHALRRFSEAVRWFDSALVLDRGLRYAHAHRGFAHLRLGHVAEARADAETARGLGQFHSSQDAQAILLMADLRSGDTAAALQRLPQLLENLSTPITPSWGLIALGRYQEAVELLVDHPTPILLAYARHPEFDPIRSDTLFRQLVGTAGRLTGR